MDPGFSRASMNTRQMNRLSIGLIGLTPGGLNQKITLDDHAKKLVEAALGSEGVVRFTVDGEKFQGSYIDASNCKHWGEKLDLMVRFIRVDEPALFALFRSRNDCLIISYNPVEAKAFKKMLYSTSKDSLKEAIQNIDDEITFKEFNTTTPDELSFDNFQARTNAPKPYTEYELRRKEEDEAAQREIAEQMANQAKNVPLLQRMKNIEQGIHDNRDVKSGAVGAQPFKLPGLDLASFGNARLKLKKTNAVNTNLAAAKAKIPGSGSHLMKVNSNDERVAKSPTKAPLFVPKGAVALPIKMLPVPEKKAPVAAPAPIENIPEYAEEPTLDDPASLDVLAPTAFARSSSLEESTKVVIKPQVPPRSPVVEEEPPMPFASKIEDSNDDEGPDTESDDDGAEEEQEDMAREEVQADYEKSQSAELNKFAQASKPILRVDPDEAADADQFGGYINHYQNDSAAAEAAGSPGRLSKTSANAGASFIQSASKLARKGKSKFSKIGSSVRGFFGRGRNRPLAAVPAAALEAMPDDDGAATLVELRQAVLTGDYQDFEPDKLESYLSTREFASVFGITKQSFYSLDVTEQQKRKRELGIL